MQWKFAVVFAALAMLLTPSMATADSVEGIEGARAKERQGRWINRQDREQLRRWGGNDDYRLRYYRPYDDGYYGGYGYSYGYGPGVGIYVDPY
jgi:hypothetical protein